MVAGSSILEWSKRKRFWNQRGWTMAAVPFPLLGLVTSDPPLRQCPMGDEEETSAKMQ